MRVLCKLVDTICSHAEVLHQYLRAEPRCAGHFAKTMFQGFEELQERVLRKKLRCSITHILSLTGRGASPCRPGQGHAPRNSQNVLQFCDAVLKCAGPCTCVHLCSTSGWARLAERHIDTGLLMAQVRHEGHWNTNAW